MFIFQIFIFLRLLIYIYFLNSIENKKKRIGTIGNRIYSAVKFLDKILINLLEEKKRKRYKKGTLHRAVIIHVKKKVKKTPLSRRVRTVIPREIAIKYPTIASISNLNYLIMLYKEVNYKFIYNNILRFIYLMKYKKIYFNIFNLKVFLKKWL